MQQDVSGWYPRTDSRHLSKDVAAALARIVTNIEGPYRELLAPGTGERPLGRRFIGDAKVSDHHAIIPTTPGDKAAVNDEERKIYDVICQRLLSAWQGDHLSSVTTVITAITSSGAIDRFHTSGTVVQQLGWKALGRPVEKKRALGRGKKDDEAAQAAHRRYAAYGHGDRRQNARRETARLAEAKKRGVPAFKILRDQSLRAIAQRPLATPDDLLWIPGVGNSTLKKHGAAICRVCGQVGVPPAEGIREPRRRIHVSPAPFLKCYSCPSLPTS